jgi:Mg-chelatase subunit ChlD/tetratricopeptide (TPR) repeat protein
MNDSPSKECAEVTDRLAEVIDGTAEERLYEHIASCDACRDARHEAERARDAAREAGADYREPNDLEARLERALEKGSAPEATAPESAQPESTRVERAATAKSKETALPSAKKLRIAAGGLLVAAGAILAIRGMNGGGDDGTQRSAGAWRGVVERVVVASGGEGLKLCGASGDACRPLPNGGEFPEKARLATDARTRARIRLSDGTVVTLERSTELALLGDGARRARLIRGALTADVARKLGEAQIELPRGAITVHGTKFALRTEESSASVDVARGSVTLSDADKRSVRVNAGESARLAPGAPPYVSFSESFGESLAWSDETFGEAEPTSGPRGLGELKAKKPGQDSELAGAVTLASHSVRVRIAGAVARTEIEEVFQNHTDQVLEGIYRFPMPAEAQIERLALEVDGKVEEGAFLDRERAASIWRGAIVNAAPQAKKPLDDIVWVPGPWKDPALLEWQRGGRFELRIFPIPKRGSRRVILAYTEVVKPSGNTRRYTYPLAYDPGGTNRVGRFDIDLEVRGNDTGFGVRPLGYTLDRRSSTDATSLGMSAQGFVPSGDLLVEYALPNRDAELTAFSYHESQKKLAAGAPAATANATSSATTAKKIPVEASDTSPYVALTLRPKLPRAERETHRTVALVVDTSRSMLGESYRRATELAVRLARELDESDRVTVLACDVTCKTLPGEALEPGVAAARSVKQFLDGITPEGGSDLVGSVKRALRELDRATSRGEARSQRVVYIGDGAPTVGEVRPGTVERAVARGIDRSRASVAAVAVGAESDAATLAALSRGGGGVVLPYSPGRSITETAYAVLAATYGQALTNVEVTLPDGLRAIAPQRLDAIAAGGEATVLARMDNLELGGEVVLRGVVGAKPFERRYPVKLVASDVRGNAFVPRLYAAARIADLEREGTADAKQSAIALSSRFNVASRYTSLLVLESAAMFKAFGLDNTRFSPEWSGEDVATGESANAPAESTFFDSNIGDDEGSGASVQGGNIGGLRGAGHGGGGRVAPTGGAAPRTATAATRPSEPASPAAPASDRDEPAKEKKSSVKLESADVLIPSNKPAEAPRPAPSVARRPPVDNPFPNDPLNPDLGPPRRRLIPMRRTFERTGEIFIDRFAPRAASSSAIAAAELDVERNENRRESVKKLFALLLRAGDIDRAARVSRRWSDKEPLDPEAITARADVLAASGDRTEAIRVLSSVVDVRPGDVAAQKRLARLHRWAGEPELGCRYSVAIAEFRASDAALLGDAVRCSRALGDGALADELLTNADAKTRSAADELLKAAAPNDRDLRGDLRVEATWSGGMDLDLALVHPDGHRVSWLGAPTRSVITARDVSSTSAEGLALNNPQAGEYVIEVVRSGGTGRGIGEVTVTAAGTTRRVPFTIDGTRVSIAIANISVRQVLVPL